MSILTIIAILCMVLGLAAIIFPNQYLCPLAIILLAVALLVNRG
jgi:hypothetical protein